MKQELVKTIIDEVIRDLEKKGLVPDSGEEKKRRVLVIGSREHLPEGCGGETYADLEDYIRCRDIRRYQRVDITELTLAELSDIAQGRDGFPASSAVVNALLRGIEVRLWESALWHRKMKGKGSDRLYGMLEHYVDRLMSFGVTLVPERKKDSSADAGNPAFHGNKISFGDGEGASGSTSAYANGQRKFPAAGQQAVGRNASIEQQSAAEMALSAGQPSVGRRGTALGYDERLKRISPAVSKGRPLVTEAVADELVKEGLEVIRLPKDAIVTPAAWDVFTNRRVSVIRE